MKLRDELKHLRCANIWHIRLRTSCSMRAALIKSVSHFLKKSEGKKDKELIILLEG